MIPYSSGLTDQTLTHSYNKMLDNYARNEDGTVYQIKKEPFDYTGSYNDYYSNIKFSTRFTSYLRLGYIVGSIGHLPESILDVGYGAGVFLEACEKEDIDTYGHDLSLIHI